MDGWFISNLVIEPIIGITCIIGNAVVLAALYKEKSLHTVTNCLIASLATADLLTGVGVPFLLLPFFELPREFYSCVFINCSILMLTGISNLHLLAVAVERFIAIKFPFWYHANFTLKSALGIALFNWVVGIVLGLVPLMGWNNGWNDKDRCGFVLVINLHQHVYFHFFGVIVTPMFFTLLIYISIFIEVKRSARQIEALKVTMKDGGGGADGGRGQQGKSEVKAEIRAARRFALVIGIFGLCWFPLEIMNCIDIWYGYVCGQCILVSVWLSHMNSVINPFLYAYGNSTLRRAMKNILCCRKVDDGVNDMSMTSSTVT